jgi:hypothetical protein
MRLKFLFFPTMLILSLVVIAAYIWPEIGAIKDAKSAYAASTKTLATIKENQNNIMSINAQLSASSDKTNLVMAYFPEKKSEEKIVDSLNYLAAGAGLSVIAIDFEKDSVPVVQAPPVDTTTRAPAAAPAADPTQPVEVAPVELAVKNANVHVIVTGDYEKILMYADQVQKMGMSNKIKQIKIAPQAADVNAPQEGGLPSTLSADIEISFPYAPALKNASLSGNNFSKASFDFTPVTKLSEYISSSLQPIQIGTIGKTNPFLPQ